MEDWKEWQELYPEPSDKEIPSDQAWRMFADWKSSGKEIGLLFVSQLGTFRAMATLTSARNGTIQLKMPSANASFNLTDARFMYGPMQAWPRWPNPPIVEIMALHAFLPHGTWLCMAEGLKPEELSSGMLPF